MSTASVVILGATGSIGQSALAVLRQHRDRFRLAGITARRSRRELEEIAAEWHPDYAVLTDLPAGETGGRTTWTSGNEALVDLVQRDDVDIVINALVGAAGLRPTIAALKAGKRVALANKESLVCAGPLVMEAAESGRGLLIPVDSEHSAILQCVQGAPEASVSRVILTASGGPFRNATPEQLSIAGPSDALRHPTWDMGAKISIDSATLANKALEVIEAHFLFGLGYDRIEAVVHPQSIIHSMVEFVDGSMLAQLGFPTMEIPLLYALSYPARLSYRSRRFDPIQASTLTFERIREEDFPAFSLGVSAGRSGGTYPAVFNAANEVAVSAFLDHSIGFSQIGSAIGHALDGWGGAPIDTLASVVEADRWARATTQTFIESHAKC